MLMPAAVLVAMVLAAIAVDSAVVFTAQRDLVNATQAAANDAAGYGVDRDALRTGSGVQLDPARLQAAADQAFAERGLRVRPSVTVEAGQVVVRASEAVDTVFATALPGGAERVTVTATAEARPEVR